ncbi:MAG: hypothetical protein AAF564_03460 [Bacteroidota bacterium]
MAALDLPLLDELPALEDLLATFLFRFLLFLALFAIRIGYSLVDAPVEHPGGLYGWDVQFSLNIQRCAPAGSRQETNLLFNYGFLKRLVR